MHEHLSAADAALRDRITELSVHIPCGGLRGPLHKRNPGSGPPVVWQSCNDEDAPQKWEGCDVSREKDLCVICFRATAGGTSRWSWLACEDCRAINDSIGEQWGFRPFALGRHSIMNGIALGGGAPRGLRETQIQRLVKFVRGRSGLRGWRNREYQILACRFDPLADVSLRVWQQEWPPSRIASQRAYTRLFGGAWPLAPRG